MGWRRRMRWECGIAGSAVIRSGPDGGRLEALGREFLDGSGLAQGLPERQLDFEA